MFNKTLVKVLSVFGAHLIIAPMSMIWTFGNLSAYLESYARYSSNSVIKSSVHTEWILAIYMACFSPGVVITQPIAKKVGFKWAGILGMVTFNAALVVSAWTISRSVAASILLLGVVCGFAGGVTIGVSYTLVQSWCPERSGLFLATTSSSSNMLAILQNQVLAYYVNPENLEPDAQADTGVFFSQSVLLNRVPITILIVTGMNLVLQGLGYLVITDPPTSQHTSTSETGITSHNGAIHNHSEEYQPNYLEFEECSEEKAIFCKDQEKSDTRDVDHESPVDLGDEKDTLIKKTVKSDSHSQTKSLRISEAIRTHVFWSVWISNSALMAGALLCNNYYKIFGLIYIPDDRFLTFVGSLMPIASPISRVVLGWYIDKAILTAQDLFVGAVSLNALLFIFMFYSAQLNRYLYLVLIVLLATAHSTNYLATPTAALSLFGPGHFSTNMGMLYSGTVLVALWAPVGVTPILRAFGWFYLFLSCSIISITALIFVACTKFKL